MTENTSLPRLTHWEGEGKTIHCSPFVPRALLTSSTLLLKRGQSILLLNCLLQQNHRTFGVRRDLCGSSSPTLCRSRVTYSRMHRTLSRRVLNISRERDSTASLGSLFQCSVTLRGKKFFLMFSWNFLCFSLCPLPLVLSLGTTAESLAPSS